MRVAIYVRVSRPEQAEGYSIDAQLRACRKYAQERGWTVVEEYVEPGVSAKTDRRPEFQRMISDAKAERFDLTSHTYIEAVAGAIYRKQPSYLAVMRTRLANIQARTEPPSLPSDKIG